jgi:hypothetical protein
MPATEVLKNIPTIGRDILDLLSRPGPFVQLWKLRAERPTNKEILGWSLALSALVFALYNASTGESPIEALKDGIKPNARPPAEKSSGPAPRPSLVGLRWELAAGIGINYPELPEKGLDQPQIVQFSMGPGLVTIRDVVPSKIGSKVAGLLILNLYLYSIALCLFPAVRIFTHSVTLSDLVSVTNMLFAATWATGSVLAVSAVVIYVNLAKLRGIHLSIAWAITVILPLFSVLIRAFWSAFHSLSGLSSGRFLCSLVVAYAISWIIFPIFAPLLYLILRFQAFLDAVL